MCTKPLSYLSVLNANDITHAMRIDIRTLQHECNTAIPYLLLNYIGMGIERGNLTEKEKDLHLLMASSKQPHFILVGGSGYSRLPLLVS